MKLVAEIKERANWRKKGPMCSNCAFFNMLEDRKRKRCEYASSAGIFATGLSCWCRHHKWKTV